MYALFLSIVLSLFSSPSPMETTYTLTIQFTGYKEVKGQILYKIVDAESREIKKEVLRIEALNQSISLQLPKGRYAISAFHDLNSNNKLDKNMVGLPTEKYGFSNNARGTFGPPSLNDQLFGLHDHLTTSITLK